MATLILEGERIVNPAREAAREDGKGNAVPWPAKELGEKFRRMAEDFDLSHLGGRVSPEWWATSEAAFKAYYVGAANRRGLLLDDVDPDLAKEAWRLVVGNPVEILGQSVMPPPGMDPTLFRTRMLAGMERAGLPALPDTTSIKPVVGFGLYQAGLPPTLLSGKPANALTIDVLAEDLD